MDSSFDQTMIPLVPCQSPCNGWLCYHAYAPDPATYPANAQSTHLDSLQQSVLAQHGFPSTIRASTRHHSTPLLVIENSGLQGASITTPRIPENTHIPVTHPSCDCCHHTSNCGTTVNTTCSCFVVNVGRTWNTRNGRKRAARTMHSS